MKDKQALVAGLAVSYGDHLRRFLVTRVRNAADIPDLVQEIFLRMLRVPDHETIRSPEAYLFTVARHVAQQHSLRQSTALRSAQLQHMIAEPQTSDVDPALELTAQQSLEQLEQALHQLSPKARAAFLLHRRDGLSLEEIGERLGVSRAMVKKYLAKSLLYFRQRLELTE